MTSDGPSAAQFAEVMTDFGIDTGYPERRLEKARNAVESGVSIDGFVRWCSEVEASVGKASDRVPAIIVASMREGPDRIRQCVADAERAISARSVRKDGPEPGASLRVGPDTQDEARTARVAFCRIISDRADPRAVAAEIGVPVASLDALVARGRELQESGRTRVDPNAAKVLPKLSAEGERQSWEQVRQLRWDASSRAAQSQHKRRRDALEESWRLLPVNMAILRNEAASGRINLGRTLSDLGLRGALATLEHMGEIQLIGGIEIDGSVAVRIVPEKDRAAVAAAKRAREQAELTKPRRKLAEDPA